MRGRTRRGGQSIPEDVLRRAASTAANAPSLDPAFRHERPVVPRTPEQRRRELRRTLMFAVVAFAIIMVVVTRDAANEDAPQMVETAVALPAFVSDGPPRHDGMDELVVEVLDRKSDGTLRVAGWAASTDRVEVIADGEVVASVPITVERHEDALARGLPNVFVGFEAEVDVPAGVGLICITRPGQLPGSQACDRSMLDVASQRVVAFYGVPYTPALGTLGDGSPAAVLDRLVEQAVPYDSAARPVKHVFEVIATLAQAAPGSDGNYSGAIGKEEIREFIDEVRSIDGAAVLDFQTGRDMYLDQIPDYVEFLSQPDVHVALDPEWDMEEGEVPNQVIGSSTATEINQVMEYLAGLIREHRLPRKVVVVHNFTGDMISDRQLLDPPPEIDLVIHIDGHGSPALKVDVYEALSVTRPFFNGFKLFYKRDFPLMSPDDVLVLDPDFISYQ